MKPWFRGCLILSSLAYVNWNWLWFLILTLLVTKHCERLHKHHCPGLQHVLSTSDDLLEALVFGKVNQFFYQPHSGLNCLKKLYPHLLISDRSRFKFIIVIKKKRTLSSPKNQLSHYSFQLGSLLVTIQCPRGVMVKAMNCGIVVREFVLQSHYVHFRANTLGKGMNPLILPPAMGK